MTKTTYTVKTRDVDCTTSRTYTTLKGAIKRFEEMYGHSFEVAIEEFFYANVVHDIPLPTRDTVTRLSGVSKFGTEVRFYAKPATITTLPAKQDIETLEASIEKQTAALAKVEEFPSPVGFVVKIGHAFVALKENGHLADKLVFGLRHATYLTQEHAARLAPRVRDANGVLARVMRIADAYRESIAEAQALLADLKGPAIDAPLYAGMPTFEIEIKA